MPQVDVGFDGEDNQRMFAGPGDTLKTTGLANCIAIVAYDTGGGGAVMRHYDTIKAFDGTEDDVYTGEEAFAFDQGQLDTVRDDTRNALLAEVDGANVAYAIALGGIWYNVDTEKPLWQSRHNLITAISGSMGVEPNMASGEATWDVNGQAWA